MARTARSVWSGRDGLRQAGQHAVAHGVAALLALDGEPQHRPAHLGGQLVGGGGAVIRSPLRLPPFIPVRRALDCPRFPAAGRMTAPWRTSPRASIRSPTRRGQVTRVLGAWTAGQFALPQRGRCPAGLAQADVQGPWDLRARPAGSTMWAPSCCGTTLGPPVAGPGRDAAGPAGGAGTVAQFTVALPPRQPPPAAALPRARRHAAGAGPPPARLSAAGGPAADQPAGAGRAPHQALARCVQAICTASAPPRCPSRRWWAS